MFFLSKFSVYLLWSVTKTATDIKPGNVSYNFNHTMTYQEISEVVQNEYLKKLENFKIESVEDLEKLHSELINVRTELYFKYGFDVMPHYRGEQLFGRDMIPGMFRPPFSDGIDLSKAREIEQNGLKIFKEQIINKFGKELIFKFESNEPYGDKWDLLFQAQHAGIKTNLIDISVSVSHSAFFACEPSDKHDNFDGQLWCILVPSNFIFGENSKRDEKCYSILDPFNLKTAFVCNVPTFGDNLDKRTYHLRLFRQKGRFFTSSDDSLNIPLNKKDFWKNMMFRVKISPEFKKKIFKEFTDTGLTRDRLMIDENEEGKNLIELVNKEMKKL